jgi:hypothetical protein
MAYAALKDVHDAVDQVIPDRTVLGRMKVESWAAAIEKLALPPPHQKNIGDWLNAVSSWIRSASSSLASLRLAALEQLLAAETQVALFTRKRMKPAAAPPASVVPPEYRLMTPGSERPRRAKLTWWDRFQTATGVFPALARFAVAAAIIGAVLLVASGVGTSRVYVFNGLERTVVVHINDKEMTIGAGQNVPVELGGANHLHVVAQTSDGRSIEEFDTDTAGGASHEVYNVASAGSLVAWTAVYGGGAQPPDRLLGAPRWTTTRAEFVFQEPPQSISTKGGMAERTVLSGIGDGVPEFTLEALSDESARNAMIATHARWDSSDSRYVQQWLALAMHLPQFPDILRERLREQPREPVNLRAAQDAALGAAHEAVCEQHRKLAAAAPDDPNLQYAATRCIENVDEQSQAFLALQKRWPENGWISQAAGYVHAGNADWPMAVALLQRASRKLPSVRDQLAVATLRMQRLLADKDSPVDLNRAAASSDYVRSLVAPEIADPANGRDWTPYVALARGDLAKALVTKNAPDFHQARVLRLVAASDGAPADVVARALALPAEAGLDADTFIPALSLATRAGRDGSEIVKLAPKVMPRDADKLVQAFVAIRNHAKRADVEAALRGMDPRMRGYAYVAAAMLWGRECPRDWRMAAQRLLFVSERPYLS